MMHASCAIIAVVVFLVQGAMIAQGGDHIVGLLIRLYVMALCIVVVAIEFDCRMFVDYIKAMDNWTIRGFFYSFIGLLTVKGEDSYDKVEGIVGLLMFGFGIAYVFMGIGCVQELKMKRMEVLGLLRSDSVDEGHGSLREGLSMRGGDNQNCCCPTYC
jgi:hypothetical protein